MNQETTNQALQTQSKNALMTTNDMLGDFGVTSDDIVVPRLLLMQNTSEFVGDGKAKLGDLINNQTMEIVATPESPVEIIPLKTEKVWFVYDKSSGTPKFIRQEVHTASNKGYAYNDFEDGKPISRDLALIFTVLLKSDVEKGLAFPYSITFKRTSFNAGKTIASTIFQKIHFKQNPLAYTVKLSISKNKVETNTFAVIHASAGSKLTDEQTALCTDWFNILKQSVVKHADVAGEDVPF